MESGREDRRVRVTMGQSNMRPKLECGEKNKMDGETTGQVEKR